MVTWTEVDVVSGGVRLHVERTGDPGPPLVLLHGFTDDGRCWRPIAGAFAEACELVTIDTRGHGRSAAPDTAGYRLDDLARDVVEVVHELGLRRPAILGHSLGAITALLVAGLRPALPSRLVLEDPPPLWAHPAPAGDAADHVRAAGSWIAALQRLTRDELTAEARARNPGWSEAEIGPWGESKRVFDMRAVTLATPAALATIDLRAVLAAVACPVTVLHGDAALGSMATPADLEVLRGLVPQLAVVHVPGAGHSIRRDQPARYATAVLEALRA